MKQAAALGVSDSQRSTEFEMSDRDFNDIAAMLYADAGIYMPVSKTTLVYSRLVKRLRALHFENFRQYCDLVGSPDGLAERREMLSALDLDAKLLPRAYESVEITGQITR